MCKGSNEASELINQSVVLAVGLAILVSVILRLEKHPVCAPLFEYLPSPFWCYFVPMFLSTLGVLPAHAPVYNFLTTYLLSGCLILLLLGISLPAILRLGPLALGMTAVGSFGVMLGAIVGYGLFAKHLPPEMWKGIGALSASWTGGSANMLAVKEGLHTPEAVFAPMVIIDTLVTYTWMGLLIALAWLQPHWDRWVGADRSLIEAATQRVSADLPSKNAAPQGWKRYAHAVWLIAISMAIGAICLRIGDKIPLQNSVLNPKSWAFLLVTGIGIVLSLTPAARLERLGASRWGSWCLYLLLAAIGAQARFQDILQTPLLLVLAVIWVAIHALILIGVGRLFRIPMFFLVAASQANIGGTASAPIVAGVYQPQLASVGLLLAIACNVVGTYLGLIVAQLCHLLHP